MVELILAVIGGTVLAVVGLYAVLAIIACVAFADGMRGPK